MKDFGGGECENKIMSIKEAILNHEIHDLELWCLTSNMPYTLNGHSSITILFNE